MKKTILFILIFFSLYACNKEGLIENSNDISYISFTKDITKDSSAVSFKTYGDNVIRFPLEVKLNGYYPTEDSIPFTLSADLEHTTLPADKYAFDKTYWFSPRQLKDTVYVELTYFAELQDTTLRLYIQVDESEKVKRGDPDFQRAILDVSDRLIRPEWWIRLDIPGYYEGTYIGNTAEWYYLGKYSEKKYTMFLEELVKDDVQFDGNDINILRIYSLRVKYRVQAYNNAHPGAPMLDEENDQEMTIPVAG